MELNKKLQISDQIKRMKNRLNELEVHNKKELDDIVNLGNEIKALEELLDLDLSPLGIFNISIFHDEDRVLVTYAGNMGDGDLQVNKLLNDYGWVTLDELRTLSSFEESGDADYLYKATFDIVEYGEVFKKKNNQVQSDNVDLTNERKGNKK